MEVLGFYYVLQEVRLCNLNPLSELQGGFTVEAARKKLFKGQAGFLEELPQAIFNDQETGKER